MLRIPAAPTKPLVISVKSRSAASAIESGLVPASQIGGYGFCNGFGQTTTGSGT